MQSRNEVVSFDSKDWVCVNVQSPLGAVMLARRLPSLSDRSNALARELSRQFEPNTQRDPATKRPRSRRSP